MNPSTPTRRNTAPTAVAAIWTAVRRFERTDVDMVAPIESADALTRSAGAVARTLTSEPAQRRIGAAQTAVRVPARVPG
ncbi:hypothetical protein GCM10009849_24680 [Sinomonas flava]|uniref:Uncharacterized protein n=1 Tax=Sinomonas flava TaxID=496857 RepID=A0ABP5NP81_9MICC